MAKMWLNQLHNTIVEVGDILPVAGADITSIGSATACRFSADDQHR